MQTTIKNLSNERLEAEISALYYEGHERSPGVRLQESGLLGMMWAEFDSRYQQGTISRETDWTEKQDWEDE